MFRAIVEFLFVIIIAMLARALLSSVFKGIGRASSTSFRNRTANPSDMPGSTTHGPQLGGELHKDPVCGTYVAESTPFRSQIAGQTFYFCSSDCREKYALVAR